MNNNIKKLIRKMPDGNWWYTLYWASEQSGKDGSYLTVEYCFDSKPYVTYRDCMKDATKHKKKIQVKYEKELV